MKLWIALALVTACSYKDREQAPPPSPQEPAVAPANVPLIPARIAGDPAADAPPNVPLIQAQVAGEAPVAPVAPLPGLPLQVTLEQCAKPKLDDCHLPSVPKTPFTVIGMQTCAIVTGIELREASGPGEVRCGLVLRNGNAVASVDTMIACQTRQGGHAVPRTRALGATCTGGELDVDLEAKDGNVATKIRVACRAADHGFACSRMPDLEAGGAAVARALADIKRVVEAHDWRALFEMCDPDHRKGQLGLGQDKPTYLAEILGLHYEGNSLTTGDAPITYDALATITKVEIIETVHEADGTYGVLGFVTLKSGTRLRLELELVRRGSGFVLSGGVG